MKRILVIFLSFISIVSSAQNLTNAVEKDSRKVGKRFLDSLEAIGMLSRWVTPEEYGAKGDGTTNDTRAIRLAAASGKHVMLRYGKTYLISGNISPQFTGQIFYGNRATIKRAPQIHTTTSTPANNATGTYVLASASGFRVGDDVAFADAGVAQSALVAFVSLSTNNPIITSIVGNTITVSPVPNCTITGSSNVYSSYVTFGLLTDCQVKDVNINGNRANFPWGRWECVGEFYTHASTDRTTVSGVYGYELPAEGYTIGGNYATATNNVFEGLNGNGYHLSGSIHTVIDGCRIINPNAVIATGHVGGCITWSNSIQYTTIVNNYCYGGRSGIGEIGAGGNSDNLVSNNTIRNSTTYGVDLTGDASRTEVSNNRIYDCVIGLNLAIGTGTGYKISRNLFDNSPVNIASVTSPVITANDFLRGSTLTLVSVTGGRIAENYFNVSTLRYSNCGDMTIADNNLDFTTNLTVAPIATTGATNSGVSITRNTILGGSRGIDIANVTLNSAISYNHMHGQRDVAIFISGTGTYSGVTIMGNECITTTTSTSAWYGIRTQAGGISISRNHVSNTRGGGNAYVGIQIEAKCTIDGNRVVGIFTAGSAGASAIHIIGGVTNSTVCNNTTDAIILDEGTTTQKVNNTTTL